jgi:hypothetical protein
MNVGTANLGFLARLAEVVRPPLPRYLNNGLGALAGRAQHEM